MNKARHDEKSIRVSRYFIGLDLSLQSPGMAVYDAETKRTSLWFVPNRKREMGLNASSPSSLVRLHSFAPYTDVETKTDAARCIGIARRILHACKSLPVAQCVVGIENYAFSKALTNSTNNLTRLAELCGVVKCALFARGFRIACLSPSQIKLLFCGSGKATKFTMWLAFQPMWPTLWSILRFDKQPTESSTIPNPLTDVVDAFAIAKVLTLQSAQDRLVLLPRRLREDEEEDVFLLESSSSSSISSSSSSSSLTSSRSSSSSMSSSSSFSVCAVR